MKIKNLLVITFAIVFVLVFFASCSETGGIGNDYQTIVLDYGDAEAFEAALVRGENLEGKTLLFTASEFHPDSTLGYNVWAGEHLNFVSERHPNIAAGDTVAIKVNEISNVLGSWIIKYELLDIGNVIVGDKTIKSRLEDTEKNNDNEIEMDLGNVEPRETQRPSPSPSPSPSRTPTPSPEPKKSQEELEYIDLGVAGYIDYFGRKMLSVYIVVKNPNDYEITIDDLRIDFVDNDKELLSTDHYVECIPTAIKPGQLGYLFSSSNDITDIDLSNGLLPVPDGRISKVRNFYEIDVSSVSFKVDDFWGIKIIGRGTNNTGKDHDFVEISAVLFDENDAVVGFGSGYDSFEADKTKSFEIYGEMLSDDDDPSIVDHVEVLIQGYSWF